jgi:GT2 family glycosyltransferase
VADVLTKATGFIFLDTKHGPRHVEYTTPLMAIKMNLVKKGLRYDPEYRGTGYREESDLQEQVRKLGYRIVFEPKFYAYHLNLEEGGDRAIQDVAARFYWKARNHAYYMLKHGKSIQKLISSSFIIVAYASLHGYKAFVSAVEGLKEAFRSNMTKDKREEK